MWENYCFIKVMDRIMCRRVISYGNYSDRKVFYIIKKSVVYDKFLVEIVVNYFLLMCDKVLNDYIIGVSV